MEQYTTQPITNPNHFKSILAEVKQQGCAISMEEILDGAASITAPIYDSTNQVSHALSVIGPVHRCNSNVPSIIEKVKRAALIFQNI